MNNAVIYATLKAKLCHLKLEFSAFFFFLALNIIAGIIGSKFNDLSLSIRIIYLSSTILSVLTLMLISCVITAVPRYIQAMIEVSEIEENIPGYQFSFNGILPAKKFIAMFDATEAFLCILEVITIAAISIVYAAPFLLAKSSLSII